MSLQDRIFLDFREAVETFLRMGFEFTSNKKLVRNDLQATITPVGHVWFSSVEKLECKQIQNKLQNPAPVDSAVEASTQKVEVT